MICIIVWHFVIGFLLSFSSTNAFSQCALVYSKVRQPLCRLIIDESQWIKSASCTNPVKRFSFNSYCEDNNYFGIAFVAEETLDY